jgi:rubrerythrin
VTGATRRQALVAAGGAALLAGAPLTPAAWAADEDDREQAEAAMAAALRLEQTALVAYEAIANSGRLSGRVTALFRELLDDDRQHAQQLADALESFGVKPPIPPRRATIQGLASVRDDAGAASFAIALEEQAIGAYSEAVRHLADANVLRTVAGAMGADGQHLVVLRQLAGRAPVPGAFERGTPP